jgi:hypothetical protein
VRPQLINHARLTVYLFLDLWYIVLCAIRFRRIRSQQIGKVIVGPAQAIQVKAIGV